MQVNSIKMTYFVSNHTGLTHIQATKQTQSESRFGSMSGFKIHRKTRLNYIAAPPEGQLG
jgi:hypothetical protein